ncbi:hypothetical protein RHSIM_Rhsim02G0167200 [Rhododendron simsii]|uniref:Uncharacterized protein n=1 Tax=Rhododendron simsii TaxID=118357 RepID=A0A834HDL9_RHOSS|nr:hypothetical protein RHSIM_Rhsim02G0167200 [Rhododendron simsii]
MHVHLPDAILLRLRSYHCMDTSALHGKIEEIKDYDWVQSIECINAQVHEKPAKRCNRMRGGIGVMDL